MSGSLMEASRRMHVTCGKSPCLQLLAGGRIRRSSVPATRYAWREGGGRARRAKQRHAWRQELDGRERLARRSAGTSVLDRKAGPAKPWNALRSFWPWRWTSPSPASSRNGGSGGADSSLRSGRPAPSRSRPACDRTCGEMATGMPQETKEACWCSGERPELARPKAKAMQSHSASAKSPQVDLPAGGTAALGAEAPCRNPCWYRLVMREGRKCWTFCLV